MHITGLPLRIFFIAYVSFFTTVLAKETIIKNTINVTTEGSFESEPDTALIQFTIASQEKESPKAYEKANSIAQEFYEILKKNGIDPKAAQLSQMQLRPVIDYSDSRQRVMGYRVQSNVSLKITDFSILTTLVDDLAQVAENKGEQSVSYILEDMQAAKEKAILNGYTKARSSAAILAQADSKTIDEMVYASIDTFESGPPLMRMYKSAAAAPQSSALMESFSPEKIKVTARINALFSYN